MLAPRDVIPGETPTRERVRATEPPRELLVLAISSSFAPAPSRTDLQPALSIDVSGPDPDTLVVTLAGLADLSTLLDLHLALREAATSGPARLLVDLDKLTFMDATTLGALVDAHRRVSAAGGTLQVRCQTRHRRLLTLTGLGGLLDRPESLRGRPSDR
jgi:anti-anti-sigma factor